MKRRRTDRGLRGAEKRDADSGNGRLWAKDGYCLAPDVRTRGFLTLTLRLLRYSVMFNHGRMMLLDCLFRALKDWRFGVNTQ